MYHQGVIRRPRLVVCALACSLVALLAVSVPALARSGQPSHRSKWVNYDNDNWGGWADPGNAGFATNPAGCDPIDPAQCMLPYPNDWFTRYDPTSATGRRLDLNVLAMPRNFAGKPIDPVPFNRSDGFSAGAQILAVVPGMTNNADLVTSSLPTDLDLAANGARNSGVVLLDATTGKRWPVWVEIDHYTSEAGVVPAGAPPYQVQQDLIIHPARNLLDGHRYIVALRHLDTDSGALARPSAAFEAYVKAYLHQSSPASGGPSPSSTVGGPGDARVTHMDRIFQDLQETGWKISSNPRDLYLAWDFTTASTQNVTGRLLAIRDNAFEQLGETKAQINAGIEAGGAPPFTVSAVTDFTGSQNPDIAREITGTFSVPCYIAPTCSPPVKCKNLNSASPFDDCPSPGSFYYTDPLNPDAVPSQVPGQTYQAGFICVVGRSAFEERKLLRPVEYGHGLFGSDAEVTAAPQEAMANREAMIYCATDWFGWANADVPNALLALSDLSNFPVLADRGQQGVLNFLYLQRLMIDPGGFASDPAFQYSPGKTFIDLSDGVYYDGNSQGGIFGGTVCAVSIDARRCALGVPGMDYSILLPRSTDYVAPESVGQALTGAATNPAGFLAKPTSLVGFSTFFDLFYPDQAQRLLTLEIVQTLWDRVDPDGYAGHMTASAEGGLLPDCTGRGVVSAEAEARACPPATPDHHVLLQVAWGDHQVANVTAFDEARTIGAESVGGPATSNRLGGGEALLASRLCNTASDGAYTANDPVDGRYCYAPDSPLWAIQPIAHYPYDGSAIAIFDSGPAGVPSLCGTDPPPPSDVDPPDTATNQDPHEAPRRALSAQDQKGAFFDLNGEITGYDGYVTDPAQPLVGGGSLLGPPYFAGGWQDTATLTPVPGCSPG